MSNVSKRQIEQQYGVYLNRDKGYDGGAWYWLCFNNPEDMTWICNGYTLAEIEEKLKKGFKNEKDTKNN